MEVNGVPPGTPQPMTWSVHPDFDPDAALGYLPNFLMLSDPRGAREQFDDRYVGGWTRQDGFRFDFERGTLKYPGDPIMHVIACTKLRSQSVLVFEHGWVVVVEADGTWEAARLD